jgi:DNA-binding NarL/FixJ family response regulator
MTMASFAVALGRFWNLATYLKPEIAVLDIIMPQLNGIETARTTQKASPNTVTW